MLAETVGPPVGEPVINTADLINSLEVGLVNHTTRENLSRLSSFWVEDYFPSATGLVGVAAHFGERVTRESMDESIRQIFPGTEPIGYSAGFGAIYRAPEDYSREEIDYDAFEVASRLTRRVLNQKGWGAEDVDVVDFANSAAALGMSDILKEKLIKEMGMRGDIEVTGTFLACDGAGNAFYRRLNDEASKGKKVLLLTVDSVGSEIPLNPEQVDGLTMQIFSNGAAALAYEPGVDFKLLTGLTEVHQDAVGALAVVPRYADDIKTDDTLDPEEPTGLIRRIGQERMIICPTPEKGQFDMNGRATAKFFLSNEEGVINAVSDQYEGIFPGRVPEHAVIHQPSYVVFQGLQHRIEKRKRLTGKGIDLPFKWIVPDGNSSGATSLIAFIRSMSEFNPGDHVFYSSFGAGGSFTTFVIEVGRGVAQMPTEKQLTAAA